ncbi:hypothetical protein M413DRAFT_162409 [Hebeloma cylindrosporum]|uniref:CWH43-like N-terminal domain-containing protein n=1 Tax=Hebeloma cylindrosporum TaxID=76867 RepID=A0A0C3C8D2_HEBCY|nr:hypothetical protein M413DRAFT_162409 [Hebeloma cylindrosporum h7]
MAAIPLRYQHWTYVWIPLATAAMWFCMLWAMLIVWLASDRPRYKSDERIAYISDIGADVLKPLFITGCAITGVGFFLCLVVERILRNSGRLLPNMRKRERVFSILAILGALIGGAGLLFLSIFDIRRFSGAHHAFLIVFIVGVGLSAIFSIIEYSWISKEFPRYIHIKIAYIAKAIIATTLILLAIVFAVTFFKEHNVGAIIEWIIAFGFTFYILTFYYDLVQSKNMERGELAARYGGQGSQTNVMTEIA